MSDDRLGDLGVLAMQLRLQFVIIYTWIAYAKIL